MHQASISPQPDWRLFWLLPIVWIVAILLLCSVCLLLFFRRSGRPRNGRMTGRINVGPVSGEVEMQGEFHPKADLEVPNNSSKSEATSSTAFFDRSVALWNTISNIQWLRTLCSRSFLAGNKISGVSNDPEEGGK